jgi:phosphate transport system substrate-binding protein
VLRIIVRSGCSALPGALAGLLAACSLLCGPDAVSPPVVRYVGSSTVANFLRDAEPVYGRAKFEIDDAAETEGGERAVLEGKTLLAGIARDPSEAVGSAGVSAQEIGRDAIALVVNSRNPVASLTLAQLKAVFTGRLRNWREVGGPDLEVEPLIVGGESATRRVFRAVVLAPDDYGGCREVRPDRDILRIVAETPGAIGQISFSFVSSPEGNGGVRALAVEGQEPSVTNFEYPIARPLWLLWRPGEPAVDAFVEWARSGEGQRVVMERFVGVRVLGAVRPDGGRPRQGVLIVRTPKYAVYDGGIYYYPHRPYDILTRHGDFIRRVLNHRGENDEKPARVELPPETYLIRTETAGGARPEFFVTIKADETTEVDVEALLSAPGQ